MNQLDIVVFRHGETLYLQGDHPRALEDACDLTIDGEIGTRLSVIKLIQLRLFDPSRAIQIYSSPTGRTLHTAKLIREWLENFAFRVVCIESRRELREGGGFSWQIFTPLVMGGEVRRDGMVFKVDKQQTNPEDYDFAEYFFRDAAHCIPESAKAQWPMGFVQALERFERYNAIARRTFDFLKSLARQSPASQIILVTHEALTCALVRAFTREWKLSLSRSEFMHLRMEDEGLFVERVGSITEGERVDVLQLTA